MSVETWKAEFCTATDLEKWIGLRKENLDEHNCKINNDGNVRDTTTEYIISAYTCQLCTLFLLAKDDCYDCPLFLIRNSRCDNTRSDEENSPWHSWVRQKDPEPMISWLQQIELPQRTSDVNNYVDIGDL